MPTRRLIMAVVATTLAVQPASAQDFVGRIMDADTGEPLPGVHVVLMDTERREYGSVVSDDDGHFLLPVPGAGEWRISATRIGYDAVLSDPVTVEAGERVEVEFQLVVEPVPLETLMVRLRSLRPQTDVDRFYERMEGGGFGRFISRDDIERTHAYSVTNLLYMKGGVRVAQGAGPGKPTLRMHDGCVPAVFIDGLQINEFDTNESPDYWLHPASIEGVEIYPFGAFGPPGYYDRRGCGLILVWTRRGS